MGRLIDSAELDRRRQEMAASQPDTTQRDEAEKAIVDAIMDLVKKYGAEEEFSGMELSIPAMMELATSKGVTSQDLQECMTKVQIYVYQLEAVTGGTWAECWEGLKSRFAGYLA